jgi:hypothetical protein
MKAQRTHPNGDEPHQTVYRMGGEEWQEIHHIRTHGFD